MATAVKLKASGVKKGFPDIQLCVARQGYHGLFIELKRVKPKGVVSPEQREWIWYLRDAGYEVWVCYGAEEAKNTILEYLR